MEVPGKIVELEINDNVKDSLDGTAVVEIIVED